MAGSPIIPKSSVSAAFNRARVERREVKPNSKLAGSSDRAKRETANTKIERQADSFIDASGARVWKGRGT